MGLMRLAIVPAWSQDAKVPTGLSGYLSHIASSLGFIASAPLCGRNASRVAATCHIETLFYSPLQ